MDDSSGNLPTWITAGIVSIIAGLTSGIVFMFRLLTTQSAKALTDAQNQLEQTQQSHAEQIGVLQGSVDECEKDRDRLHGVCQNLRVENESIKVRLSILEQSTRKAD